MNWLEKIDPNMVLIMALLVFIMLWAGPSVCR